MEETYKEPHHKDYNSWCEQRDIKRIVKNGFHILEYLFRACACVHVKWMVSLSHLSLPYHFYFVGAIPEIGVPSGLMS